MKDNQQYHWTCVFSCVLLGFIGGNVYFIFAQEECENRAATNGACTSCDHDYAAIACFGRFPCEGNGYTVSNTGLGTTQSEGTRISGSNTTPCLGSVKCLEIGQEEGEIGTIVMVCRNSLGVPLASGTYYYDESCN